MFEHRMKEIRCAVWRNESSAGRTWYNVTLSRTWRQGDEVHDSPGSLNGLPDIVLAIATPDAARDFILKDGQSKV